MESRNLIIFLLVLLTFSLSYALVDYNISYPKEVEIGKWFNVSVTIVSDEDVNVSVYSYVYKGLNVVSQGWTANKKELSLKAGQVLNISLEDMIKHNTEEGIYNLKVRVKYDDTVLNKTATIKVFSKSNLFEENYIYTILVIVSIIGLGLVFVAKRS